ncbi:MAG: YncE family protein [Erythrobacter sp.]|uniref:Vgb family protein n=1 Tax=Erythrobacter sp. TaxID=1042 RepID=UPI00262913E5|nr:YncE family protein [Erythrobacter sp.]MDJ0977181.1 YncE family protein [Erythrobacter sp.]
MRRTLALPFFLAASACASEPAPPDPGKLAFDEKVIEVPGFVDFLVIDGDTVWATNATSREEGMVEQWSTDGKIASVAMPRPCGTMALAEGFIWQASCPELKVYKINTKTAEIDAILDTGLAEPRGETNVVSGAGSVWVPTDADGVISRIDPTTDTVIAAIETAPGTFFLAFGEGALWAVASEESLLQRIDPETNAVTGSVKLGAQPGFLTAGEGAVWVQEQGDGTVAKVDPDTLEVIARTKVGDSLLYGDIDVADGKVWLRTTEDQTFVVLEASTGEIIARVGRPEGSGAIRYSPNGVWTSAHDVDSINWWTPATPAIE